MQLWKNISRFALGWLISIVVWLLLRNVGPNSYLETINLEGTTTNIIFFYTIMSLLAGIVFGGVQTLLERRQYRSFYMMLISGLGWHFLVMILMYLLLYIFIRVNTTLDAARFVDFLVNPVVWLHFGYSLAVNAVIVIVLYLDRLLGPGNLRRLLTGKFSSPREEERIFMFLDLVGSTTYAEQMGHLKYSGFIQQCYLDLSAIEKTGAQVYQYVGDGVVLTWEYTATSLQAALDSYFIFTQALEQNEAYYLKEFGATPKFRAGLHFGAITAVEVGSLKKEIAYHGDTINTAARLEGQAKAHNVDFIVAEEVSTQLSKNFTFQKVGSTKLKGRSRETDLYKVKKTNH